MPPFSHLSPESSVLSIVVCGVIALQPVLSQAHEEYRQPENITYSIIFRNPNEQALSRTN